ncbi:MAG: hypothetical protein VKN17_06720 [Cyanobacteriota bacterium]|jgi:hypothetical protein|nr:hypothetical protein [Synechococcus sp. FGCU3]MEB3105457.1 hypothetical protein [Cyanobacteriota bacterium]
MDDRSPVITHTDKPMPVVMTLDTTTTCSSAAPLSFTIPLHEPPSAPSWLELLGQR